MNLIIHALKGTPIWVYVVFFYLISIGIKALKSRVISLKKMFVLPFVFLAMFLYDQLRFFNLLFCAIWLLCLIVGSAVGWVLNKKTTIKADKKKYLIEVPGSVVTLILILTIFAVKYCFGYLYATQPTLKESFIVHTLEMISSGVITGLLLGKAFCFLRKFRLSNSVDLTKNGRDE